MQDWRARAGVRAMAWLGSALAACLAGNASADTQPLSHNSPAPVRINGYVSAGSESSAPGAFANGPQRLRRDASQAAQPPRPAASFFQDVSHDEMR